MWIARAVPGSNIKHGFSFAFADMLSQWIVPNFAGSAGRLQSSTFDVGGYSWWVHQSQLQRQPYREPGRQGDIAATAPVPVSVRRSLGSLVFTSTRRLLFFPKGNNTANNDHVSFFLSYADANNPPPGSLQCPGAAFSLRIKNDRGRELDYVRRKELRPCGLQEFKW